MHLQGHVVRKHVDETRVQLPYMAKSSSKASHSRRRADLRQYHTAASCNNYAIQRLSDVERIMMDSDSRQTVGLPATVTAL